MIKSSGLTQLNYCALQEINYQIFTYQYHRMTYKSQHLAVGFIEAMY